MQAPLFRLRPPYTTDIVFLNRDDGWIGGIETPVMFTPNGGVDWYEQTVPEYVTSHDARIMALDFINQTYGWAVGDMGVIMKTNKGNHLGSRLWYGLADPIFLSVISSTIVAVVFIAVGVHRLRRRNHIHTAPEIR